MIDIYVLDVDLVLLFHLELMYITPDIAGLKIINVMIAIQCFTRMGSYDGNYDAKKKRLKYKQWHMFYLQAQTTHEVVVIFEDSKKVR